MKSHSRVVLRLIAAFRYVKAVLLIISGIAALRVAKAGVAHSVARFVEAMPYASQHQFVARGLAKVMRLPPKRIEELAIVLFLYAALFIVEGTGLWMEKVWAEWLTIVATTSFIPFEVYEVAQKTTALRIAILVANIAIVIYLVVLRIAARHGRS